MIPGKFEYHRPDSIAQATALLTEHGDDARVIAGGHSLIPLMKLRLAVPDHLIDLQGISDLTRISRAKKRITIGAMTTQHALITDDKLAEICPILREAALQIADPQVRYLGTIGGNVANGDPGNDMPGLMQCLNAKFELAGPKGTRTVAARDFYESAYVTARAEDEILTQISFPAHGPGYAYEKQKRKIGDYATAAAAVIIGDRTASVAMTNLSDTPIWSAEASKALARGDDNGAVAAMMAAIDPGADMRGPVEFKMHVAAVILRRAIDRARSRAEGRQP